MERASYRLLVVDDHKANRDLLAALLSEQGHRCTPAGDGVEALAKISEGKFDAVITDVVMPNMDGITLTKEIARHYPSLPVMAMTGNSTEYSAETTIAAGAREFIAKPFSLSEFFIRLHKMMRDHEVLCQVEEKNREVAFNSHRNSLERIEDLKRETEHLKSQLSSLYYESQPF